MGRHVPIRLTDGSRERIVFAKPGKVKALWALAATLMAISSVPAGAQVSNDVVKIGVLGDESGPFAESRAG